MNPPLRPGPLNPVLRVRAEIEARIDRAKTVPVAPAAAAPRTSMSRDGLYNPGRGSPPPSSTARLPPGTRGIRHGRR